jgi:hypothetical protein
MKGAVVLALIALVVALLALCNPHFEKQRLSVTKTLEAGEYLCVSDWCSRIAYRYEIESFDCVQNSVVGYYYDPLGPLIPKHCSSYWEKQHSGYSPRYDPMIACNYGKQFRVEFGVCVVKAYRNSYVLRWF